MEGAISLLAMGIAIGLLLWLWEWIKPKQIAVLETMLNQERDENERLRELLAMNGIDPNAELTTK